MRSPLLFKLRHPYANMAPMLYRAAALTVNNPTNDHRLLMVPELGGKSELEKRLDKKFKGSRVKIEVGDESAPSTGTPHLQVC